MSSRNLWSYETLGHAVAGAAGGVTAMSIFYPLDTVRSRLQVESDRTAKNTFEIMKELVESEGLGTLYRGIKPVLQSLCCSNFVYFYVFHGLRSRRGSESVAHKATRDLLLSSIAGVVNVLVTTPLWVVNSRMKLQGIKMSEKDKKEVLDHTFYNGMIEAIIEIGKTEGLKALWSGMVPSLLLVINPAIHFTVYESLKSEAMKALERKKLNAATYFLIGAVAKSISTVLTYPLQLVQMKLRSGSNKLQKLNIIQVLAYIIRHQGFSGLYKGLEAKVMQTVLTAALMFLCYEKIAAFIFLIMKINRKSH